MTNDPELLRDYAENRSEEAFAELVRRHLPAVYAVALRQVGGDAHLARDVAQSVFIDLARKAAPLAHRPVLAGWLFRSARFAAAKAVRADRRRQAREHAAHLMHELAADPTPIVDWDRIRPALDDLIGELNERDREAVLLRFFEGRALADIGAQLQLTEEGARSRVERALERLRAGLARRGVTSTTAALAVVLANQVSAAVPAGLAAHVTHSAIAATASGGGLLTFLTTMNTKTIILGVSIVSTLIVGGLAAATALQQQSEKKSSSATTASTSATRSESVGPVTTPAPAAPSSAAASLPLPAPTSGAGGMGMSVISDAQTGQTVVTTNNTGQATAFVPDSVERAAAYVDKSYAGLFPRLNFTPQAAANLRSLLIAKLRAGWTVPQDAFAAGAAQGLKMSEVARRIPDLVKEAQAPYDAKIQALLGEADYRSYQAYAAELAQQNRGKGMSFAGRMGPSGEMKIIDGPTNSTATSSSSSLSARVGSDGVMTVTPEGK
jgi:RNA polymerase sigma factor (sigma-70 family)